MNNIKVAIAEDHALVREGLSALLQTKDNLDIVLEVENGKELIDQMSNIRVEVVLLDIDMPVMGGKETLEKLNALYPHVYVIMISMHYEDAFIREFMRLGARGFLPKNSELSTVHNAIESVRKTGYYFDDQVSIKLLRELVEAPKKEIIEEEVEEELFSEREKNIIQLICEEKNNVEIAESLALSKRTVEGHRSRIMDKIEAKNIAGVIIYAIRKGIVDIQ